jgi:hypothetical protein
MNTVRVVGALLSLAMVLLACGRPADPAPTTRTRQQLASQRAQEVHAGPVNPDPRVGAIFFGGGDLHGCTGAVLHSSRRDLMLTAAHCLAQGVEASFVPGLAGDATPADMWTVTAVYLDPRWVAAKDPHADYAIARVSRPGGGSLEAQFGSGLSLGTSPAPGSRVNVVAYLAGVGGTPIGCQASTGVTEGGYPSLPCAGLGDGTSGAPWISGSMITGVIGGLEGGGCGANVSYSAPFDEHTALLLARAEAGGPADVAPDAFDDGC